MSKAVVKPSVCRWLLGLLALALIAPACRVEDVPALGTSVDADEPELTLQLGGQTRRYQLYVPAGSSPDDGWPLVIVLHGLGSNAAQTRRLTGFDEVAGEHRFIVAYPEGLASAWIDAGVSEAFTENDIASRNLAFMAALIDGLDAEYGVDDRRIYMTGLSNGGMFAFHAACSLSDRIAAVGLIAAASVSQSFDTCQPSAPVAYIAFHGTSDTVVPYGGGPVVPGFDELGEFQSAHQAAAFWSGVNKCYLDPATTEFPDTVAADFSVASRQAWEPCASGSAVHLITLDGAGHTWPGHPPSTRRLGPTNLDIDATTMLWEFFAANPK